MNRKFEWLTLSEFDKKLFYRFLKNEFLPYLSIYLLIYWSYVILNVVLSPTANPAKEYYGHAIK